MKPPTKKNLVAFLKMVAAAEGRACLDEDMKLLVREALRHHLIEIDESHSETPPRVHLTSLGDEFLREWFWRWLGPLRPVLDAALKRVSGG